MLNEYELVKRISSDLKIFKFSCESNETYKSRLIYSAVAEWARSMLSNKSFFDVNNYENYKDKGVDKLHIIKRLTQISHAMIFSIYCERRWFEKFTNEIEIAKDISGDLAKKVLKDMIFINEFPKVKQDNTNELGRHRHISIPNRYILFNKRCLILGGGQSDYKDKIIFSGCGRWIEDNNLIKKIKFTDEYCLQLDLKIYYNSLIKNAAWSKTESLFLKQLKIFDLKSSYFNQYEKGWVIDYSNSLEDDVYIGKKDNSYYLIKKYLNKMEIASLNSEWYGNEREILRVIYSMRKIKNIQTFYKLNVGNDFVKIKLENPVPKSEEIILKLASWELENMNNKNERIMRVDLWNEIKEIFILLGLTEKEY